MTRRKRVLLAFALFDLLLLAMVVTLLLYINSPERQTNKLAELGVARFPDAQLVHDFTLQRHDGGTYSRADLMGQWQLVFFGFTNCPDFCPLTMQALDRFYDNLQETGMEVDTQVVMITVDPARDSAQVLAEYLADFHESFVGLTGPEDAIQKLAAELLITFHKPEEHDEHGGQDYVVQHSDYVAVIDPGGRYHSVMRAPFTPANLMTAYSAIREQ